MTRMAAPSITSKTSRDRLQPRREPYFVRIDAGLYLGFRKIAAGSEGTWIARKRDDGTGKQVYNSLGAASSLEYDAAVRAANTWANAGTPTRVVAASGTTVKSAVEAYVTNRRLHKGEASAADAERRFKRLVYSRPIANIELSKLKAKDIKAWVADQLPSDLEAAEPDALRRAKDSSNRSLASLKAALNLAFKEGLVASNAAWANVSKFPSVARKRDGFLTREQRADLLAESEDDLAQFMRGLLLTAARPGELANANVSDFNRHRGTLALDGKTGPRVISLSRSAIELLSEVSKDRIAAAPLFETFDKKKWWVGRWSRDFRKVADACGLTLETCAYCLRHTAISEMLMAGMSPFIVAKIAGTSTKMIDDHYGHITVEKARELLDSVAMF
ncbi:tyrosine-type recombinase/integrase [Paraburkholderia saeva]|uniref:tyrosine-type recombinase/integrase n=1 Tax=Paraburkholderia saeva TaxID=2777537 RepID=UPI001DA3B7F3|nr:tyrosine-type recombinase/integrase [Paraburkholderia saeva]CAG4916112.1 Tyrosine recombinase XerC [Paraburkholderia saeva]